MGIDVLELERPLDAAIMRVLLDAGGEVRFTREVQAAIDGTTPEEVAARGIPPATIGRLQRLRSRGYVVADYDRRNRTLWAASAEALELAGRERSERAA